MFGKKSKEKELYQAPQRMAELLLTRFTHDIAGPISSVANGLEFIMDGSDSKGDTAGIEIRNQAIDLVEDSSKQSLARLQAYRVAYGVVYNEEVMTKTKEVKDIVKRYFHKSQIEIRWNSALPDDISAAVRRMLMSMILTTARVLIYGGKVSIVVSKDGKSINVKGQAEKFKEPKIIKSIFDDKGNIEPDVENIPYFFIRDIVAESKIDVSFSYKDDEVKLVEFKANFPS